MELLRRITTPRGYYMQQEITTTTTETVTVTPVTNGPAINLDPTTPDEGDWEKRQSELLFHELTKEPNQNLWRIIILKRMQELVGIVRSAQQVQEEVVKQSLATPAIVKTPVVVNDL